MNKLIRSLMVIAVGASMTMLAACNNPFDKLPTLNIGSQVDLNTEYGIIAGYGAVVGAMKFYKNLPLCRTGTKPSLTNLCAKRSVIVTLQKDDRIANAAINNMNNFIKNNPSVSPSTYIAAARNAILAVQNVVNAASNEANANSAAGL